MFDFAAIGSLQHLEVSLELRGATIVLFVVEKAHEVALIQIVGRWGRLLAWVLLLAVELLHVNVCFLDLQKHIAAHYVVLFTTLLATEATVLILVVGIVSLVRLVIAGIFLVLSRGVLMGSGRIAAVTVTLLLLLLGDLSHKFALHLVI